MASRDQSSWDPGLELRTWVGSAILSEIQSGYRCVVCGSPYGVMVKVGHGEISAHEGCVPVGGTDGE